MSAFAAGSAAVQVADVQARAGQEVAVTFCVENATFANYDVAITWDTAVMTLTEIRAGEDYTGLFMANPANGFVSYANSHDLTLTGALFTAIFQVAENAPDGRYSVGLDVEYIADMYLEDLTVTVTAGSVTVGDVEAETVPPAPTEDMTYVPPETIPEKPTEAGTAATDPAEQTQPVETEGETAQPGDTGADEVPAPGDDNMPMYIALGVMVLSAVVIIVVLICKRRTAK